jgi:hypothetical protein
MYELGMTSNGECDTLNSEYKVVNNKNYHLSYTHMLGFIKIITSTNIRLKLI